MPKLQVIQVFLVGLLAISLAGCGSSGTNNPGAQLSESAGLEAAEIFASDESAESHGKDAEPNYALVFPQDAVNRIDITLSEESWADLQSEMAEQFGEQGTGEQGPGGPGRQLDGQDFNNQQPPPDGQDFNNQPPQDQAPAGGGRQPPGGGLPERGGGLDFGDTSYVASTISFNGETWGNVGFRYSGNSTLRTSWKNGTNKISFRLDFDEFEDEDPSVTDQRFYGFKQIAFKSNAMDDSYLREKVTADIFRAAGVAASQTAFYEVYIDSGEGPVYFGLYTAVEIVDDTLIETQFADDGGNVYKPEGSGAAFAAGTFSEESFEKQTNADEADWSDIQAVFAALHAETRTQDPAAWRAGLEAVFDVDAFIRWLAADTIIQNWDTYGAMAHNYYLYTDPSDGLLTWIPWDNNMALSASAAGPGRDGSRRGVRALDLAGVGAEWPLIRYLMDDPTYQEKYRQYLAETIQGAFEPEQLEAAYRNAHDLIAPSVEKEAQGYTQLDSSAEFEQALETLVQHAKERYEAVTAYLAND